MLKYIILGIMLVAICIASLWFFSQEMKVPHREIVTKAPDFKFTDLNGKPYQLADFKGKVLLLHFWASWCSPCVKEFPALMRVAAQYPKQLYIIAISVDNSVNDIQRFIGDKKLPNNILLVWDENKTISNDRFQSLNYPETIIVGCDFAMRQKIIGIAEDWSALVSPIIQQCAYLP